MNMKLFKKGESGQVLAMALILLALGSLLVIPTVNLASTSLSYNRTIQQNTIEYYAADAGVEYALCELGNSVSEFGPVALPSDVNDRAVTVTAEDMGGDIYKITSTATRDDGSSTTIESYVTVYADYTHLFANAITSPGDVIVKPGGEVNGDVQLNGELDNKGDIDGEVYNDPIDWPSTEVMTSFFFDNVDGLTPLADGYTIDISSGTEADPFLIPPLYASGSLTITGNGIALLEGTIYGVGDIKLQPGCTLKLNGQSIFSEGGIQFQPGSTSSGEGCIVAVGDVDYQPNIEGDDFVFLMSLEGITQLKPGNDFYGSIAGNSEVELLGGTTLNWVEYQGDLNFPGAGGEQNGDLVEPSILTWKISTS